jgi:N-acetylglucosaminyldiphosphoundecaprenol N-acetyl-beta-D-mannosaminyltransferase
MDAIIATRELFGFPFVSEASIAAITDRLLATQPDDGLLPLVVTPNVDYIVRLAEPDMAPLRAALQRARWVLPDGQPIVWASRAGGQPLAARLPGSAVFPVLWRAVIAQRRRAVAVVARESTGARLQAELPGLGVVVPPMFDEADEVQLAAVVAQCWDVVQQIEPEFVFIGISFPKQQQLALALIDLAREHGKVPPLFLTFGAAFEMYLGLHRRAPRWMQEAGLEWLFRFALEPKRLFRRYFVTDMRFIPMLCREVGQLRLTRRRGAS